MCKAHRNPKLYKTRNRQSCVDTSGRPGKDPQRAAAAAGDTPHRESTARRHGLRAAATAVTLPTVPAVRTTVAAAATATTAAITTATTGAAAGRRQTEPVATRATPTPRGRTA
jgi:hypothetical protein